MPAPPRVRWTTAVLPFAGAYFLSYLYRTANAVIGPVLQQELSLSAGEIGLLTGAYFLAFAAAQIPLGMLLDRFGARRVESALLLVAAAGAAAFAAGTSPAGLAAGRALIGLGVSACLMAAFKSFSGTFGTERQASLTGWIMSSGGLGAVAAGAPMDAALRLTGWREVFLALAAATVAGSGWIFLRAPEERRPAAPEPLGAQWRGVATVFRSERFWHLAPMSVVFTGGFMAVHGLWATGWLMQVNGHPRDVAADHLTAMSVAMLVVYVAIGLLAAPLARRGISSVHLLLCALPLAWAALLAIAYEASAHTQLLWIAYCTFSCFGTLAYSVTAREFPLALAGRANTALNVLIFVGAFALQWGIGALVDLLRTRGLDTAAAHRGAFAALLAVQSVAWLWFAISMRRAAGASTTAAGTPPAAPRPSTSAGAQDPGAHGRRSAP